MAVDPALLDWMLDSDPALRWQVERDLAGAAAEVWQATRARVATEGYGARLLAHRDPDGQWAGGAYFPAGFDENDPDAAWGRQPYTATTWSLNALRDWGLDAAALAHEAELLDRNATWEYHDLPYWHGEVDCCINAFTLANGAWLGADVDGIATWFGEHVMTDGGWNCEWEVGKTVSSFHSTLNSLVGILYWEIAAGDTRLRDVRHRAEEYLLERRLMYRLSTGERHEFVRWMPYPWRWWFNVLSASDYFRMASQHDGTAPDPRLADAIAMVRADRRPDERWLQDAPHEGRVWFEVDVAPGEPSKWLTFFGTRLLDWWDRSTP